MSVRVVQNLLWKFREVNFICDSFRPLEAASKILEMVSKITFASARGVSCCSVTEY